MESNYPENKKLIRITACDGNYIVVNYLPHVYTIVQPIDPDNDATTPI